MFIGKQSILFKTPPRIVSCASIVGQKESEGPLGKYFDVIVTDPMAGSTNWEEAESALQKKSGLSGTAKG